MTPCYARLIVCSLLFAGTSYADVSVHSPMGGTVTFSQKTAGEHYATAMWGKMVFSNRHGQADLTQPDRVYESTSPVSPSGRYLVVNSLSGGELVQEDGSVTYTDRAYCSVVDMRNGCITSDWSGEACGYTWTGKKDILAGSARPDAETFDFLSQRPTLKAAASDFALLEASRVSNLLRCDAPAKENINDYQRLADTNHAAAGIINRYLLRYVTRTETTATVKSRSVLFTEAKENSKTRGYLVRGDRIRIIQRSSQGQWVNIGYVNAKGSPLIAWVKAETLDI